MTATVIDLVERLRYRVNNPSAWDDFDQGASDTIAEAADRIEALERAEVENATANARLTEQMERTAEALAASQAEAARLREALTQARIWHEAEDKALSKQPPSHGPNGNQWARLQHQEQMAEIDAALSLSLSLSLSSGSKT